MNRRKSFWVGVGCVITGLVLLLAAAFLVYSNVDEDDRAQRVSEEILAQFPTERPEIQEPIPEEKQGPPLYVTTPDMEMSTVQIDGHVYIGRIDLPTLGRSLPVMGDWSYPQLRMAPCRYLGSAYQEGFVIIGHNYRSHFGTLRNLQPNDKIVFTDMDGHVFHYKVAVVEQLHPSEGKKLAESDWALTLVTCTLGGSYRLAVRCFAA